MNDKFTHMDSNGTKQWHLDGKLHREDGPAIEWADGAKAWYRNGLCHREDGPAVKRDNGIIEWWLNNRLVSVGERPENWNELVLLAQVEQVMND